MPNASMANAAIVDLEPIADSLRTVLVRILETHLPPWVDVQALVPGQRCLEGARLIFQRGLADILAWTPRASRNAFTAHYPWRESEDGDPDGGEVDSLTIDLLETFELVTYCQKDSTNVALNAIVDSLQDPLNEWLLVLLHRQLSAIVGPFVYHAWHARPMGTAYILQPGGIMISPRQVMLEFGDRFTHDLDQPMELNLAEHWAAASQSHVNPLDEAEVMASGDVVSEDPAVVSSFICEEIRKHPDPQAAYEAHEAGSRRPTIRSTRTKLDAIQEAYRKQSSIYTGPAKVGPTISEHSVIDDLKKDGIIDEAASVSAMLKESTVAGVKRRLKRGTADKFLTSVRPNHV